jgi:threonine aldolase
MLVDLRSDTVTRPSPAMREAMMAAPLGDDVFGDDPSVNALQEGAAARFGMEAALFCPSGTMTNQIAINVHTRPGDEVICDALAHVYLFEGGGIARNSGSSVRLLAGDRGRFDAAAVAAAINPDDVHRPRSSLVAVEDTVNKGGGAIWELRRLEEIAALCRERGLAFHLDGARLFNALVETGEDPRRYGALFDSISICLSMGLGAPVGSLLLGRKDFIARARRVRKAWGGGMRQAGLLAAAGSYALAHNVEGLKADHRRARELGSLLASRPWVRELLPVDSNIVIARLGPGLSEADLVARLKEEDILASGFGPGLLRFVTHLDFDDRGLERAAAAILGLAP